MALTEETSVQVEQNVRQWRDFLDILLFARQNKAKLVVPDRLPILNKLIEFRANPSEALERINHFYTRTYKDLRVFRGGFNNISSLLVLNDMIVSSGKLSSLKAGDRSICYTYNNLRVPQLEREMNFLAVAINPGPDYVGSKIFMREHMIELMSL